MTPMSAEPEASLESWQRREKVVECFEAAWESGHEPALDDYLPPDGPDRLPLLRDLVRADLEWRNRRGLDRSLGDYLRRYPELAADGGGLLHLIQAGEHQPPANRDAPEVAGGVTDSPANNPN